MFMAHTFQQKVNKVKELGKSFNTEKKNVLLATGSRWRRINLCIEIFSINNPILSALTTMNSLLPFIAS
jgi:hypothetical protein